MIGALSIGLARPSGSSTTWSAYTGIWNASDAASGAVVGTGGFQLSSSSTGVGGARGTVALTGKVYWSVVLWVNPGPSGIIGLANTSMSISANTPSDSANGWGYYSGNGHILNNSDVAYGNSFTLGDIITIAVDVTATSVWFAKNGVWQNSGNPLTAANPAFTNLSGTLYPWCGDVTSTTVSKYTIAPPGQTAVGLA